ncbi:cupin domain-containing protein [Actinomadura rubrisoli]|nr:cupin domain-containing protein [Actinomadura rubrisoli]
MVSQDSRRPAATVMRDLLAAESQDAVAWKEWSEPGRAGVQMHVLYATEPPQEAVAFLVRYSPGAHGDLHRHLGYELMFVLAGEMVTGKGALYRTGDLVIEAPGSVHQITTETGFTVLAVREAPTVPMTGAR